MRNKNTALFFLTFAYAILLGHSIVPHHHDDDHQITAKHNFHEHHEHNDNESKSEDHDPNFDHFLHATDGFVVTGSHISTNNFSKQVPFFDAYLGDYFHLAEFDIPPLLLAGTADNPIYFTLHSPPTGLRAPPAMLI